VTTLRIGHRRDPHAALEPRPELPYGPKGDRPRMLALVMPLTGAVLTAIVAFTGTAGLLDSMIAASFARSW